ncbi:MAG: arylsulfatase [bacterium]|nr:arylsulfatase [bacterium]
MTNEASLTKAESLAPRGHPLLPFWMALVSLVAMAGPASTLADSHTQSPPSAGVAAADRRPNILILLADDLGWGDVSYHGSEIRTPHIDNLARRGIELDRFYVQPTCSPTRTALMTGKSPMRIGITRPITKNEKGGLPLGETLLPEHLARAGYQSLMSGKWHLGHYTPEMFPHARGFESFYGHVSGGIGYWDHNHGGGHDWQRDGVTVREEGYTTHLIADEALRLLTTRDRTRPVFLYVAFNAPHIPNESPSDALARYASIEDQKRRIHAGMVSELDSAIGRILAGFEEEGILGNTLVFFSSDNGGIVPGTGPPALLNVARFFDAIFDRPIPIPGFEFLVANLLDGASDNGRLRGAKGDLGDGGSRVPAAIWWPGHLENGTHERFMTISDLLPTLMEAIGAADAIPGDLNGRSQWAALNGDPSNSETPDYVTTGLFGEAAFYRPPWKLHVTDPPELYDVFDDPYEERNVAGENPEVVEALLQATEAWPRGRATSATIADSFFDPDLFGGREDREPWADVARERASRTN